MPYLALGDFTFELKNAELNTIEHQLELTFSEISRIGNNPAYFSNGKFKESITLEFELLLQKQNTLESFLQKVREKEPFFMVLGYGKVIGDVLIESLEIKEDSIIPNGASLKKKLAITLKKVYE